MQAHRHRTPTYALLASLLVLALLSVVAAVPQATQQQQEKGKAKSEDQKKEDQKKEDQQKEEKKKGGGGLFGGVRAVTEAKKSDDAQLTASAGAKGVGEGKAIGNVIVNSADREKVARMASAMPGPAEMKAFLDEGKLAAERKGGTR